LALILVVAFGSAGAQVQLVACDLVDRQAASGLLTSVIKQHTPSRQTQATDGAIFSTCTFFAERSNLVTKLFEYQTSAAALRAFAASTSPGGAATFTSEPGLGDKAASWRIGSEASGYVVVKGKRVFMLDTRWHDSSATGGSREHLKPVVESAVRRL
jgi:hypothetical protein